MLIHLIKILHTVFRTTQHITLVTVVRFNHDVQLDESSGNPIGATVCQS